MNLMGHARAHRSPWMLLTIAAVAVIAAIAAALSYAAPAVVYPFL